MLSVNNPYGLIFEILVAASLFIFLFWRRPKKKDADSRELLRIEIKLSGGFQPSEVHLNLGRPTQLVIHRFEAAPEDELFEIEDLDIYELLPAYHTTIIAINPHKRGSFPMILGGEKKAGLIIVE